MRGTIAITFCILILILFAGCTEQKSPQPFQNNQPVEPATDISTPAPTHTTPITPEPKVVSVFDQAPSQPPADLSVSVTVQKDPVYSTITVSFDGGRGQDLIQSILVKTTLSTGEVTDMTLGKNKGDEITINGSKGTDQVQVAVMYMNGSTYVITDTVVSQSRAAAQTLVPVAEKKMNTSEEGLFPGPVTQPPNSLSVSVDVEKEPIYRVITGTFRGGHGQSLISKIEMHAVLGTGETTTKVIANNIGAIGEIQGSNGIDRIQVVVSFKNGEVYKILDKTFKSRG